MRVRTKSGKRRGTGRGGYTLIELLVAMVIFTITSGAVSMSIASSMSLARTNRERSLASEAAVGMIERLRGEDFESVFARYNLDPADDPLVPGTAPGRYFEVPGLTPAPDDADGFVGAVLFPGDGFVLDETDIDTELGMPRDLDGDGDAGNGDVQTYRILPVRVRLEWLGSGGRQSVDVITTIARK